MHRVYWWGRGCTESKRTVILSGLTIHIYLNLKNTLLLNFTIDQLDLRNVSLVNIWTILRITAVWHKDSECARAVESGIDRLAWHGVVRNLQCIKNAITGKWDKTKYASTSSQCGNSQYAPQIHWSFPCTSHSYSSFLFLSASGYQFSLKSAKCSYSVLPTLCHPMNHSPPGSSVHGILQAEYWSGLPFPSPVSLPHPGIKPGSPTLEVDSLLSEPQGKPWQCKATT